MNTDSEDTTMIKLRSMADEDGNTQVFDISMAAAQISDLIRDAAGEPEDREDDDDDGDNAPLEIEVSRVKGPCLAKVVDFMIHHHEEKMKEIPTPLGGSSFNEVRLFFSFDGTVSAVATIRSFGNNAMDDCLWNTSILFRYHGSSNHNNDHPSSTIHSRKDHLRSNHAFLHTGHGPGMVPTVRQRRKPRRQQRHVVRFVDGREFHGDQGAPGPQLSQGDLSADRQDGRRNSGNFASAGIDPRGGSAGPHGAQVDL